MTAKKTLSLILALLFIISALPAATLSVSADPPESIRLNYDSYEEYVGKSLDLYVYYEPSYNWESCTWETSDDSVVSISYSSSDYCSVTFTGLGEATLTATSESGLTASCAFTVKAYPTIDLDEIKYISVGYSGDPEYFAFTPSEDGWYRFFSIDGVGNPAELYSTNGNYLSGCKWYNDSRDFRLDYQMTAGETYVYQVGAYSYYGGDGYSVQVVKMVPPDEISLDRSSYEGYPLDSFRLNVSYSPDLAVNEEITWTSSDSEVASVNYYGEVYLNSPGTATITATSASGLEATCGVVVLSPLQLTLGETMTAVVKDENGTGCFEFTPEEDMTIELLSMADDPIHPSCEVRDEYGSYVASAYSGGEGNNFKFNFNIYAGRKYFILPGLDRSADEYPVSYEFTAYRLVPAESISFAQGAEGEGRVKDRINLTVVFAPERAKSEYIYWSSSDPNVATADYYGQYRNGLVILQGVGEATITARTSETNLEATFHVTVKDMEEFVVGETKTVTLVKGKTVNYKFVAPENGKYVISAPDTDSNVSLSISKKDGYADVDWLGGSGYEFLRSIKANAGDEFTFSLSNSSAEEPFDVIVTLEKLPAAETIVIPESVEIEFGDGYSFDPGFLPEGCATEEIVSWTSDNEEVATVTSYGYVESVSAGTATVTATSENGLTASCAVTVTMPPILTAGEPMRVTADNSDSQSFMFRPTESAEYSFGADNFSEDNSVNIRVAKVNGWNVGSSYGETLNVSLDADAWYKVSVSLRSYPDGPVTFGLNVAETVDATGILITADYLPDMYVGNSFNLEAQGIPWNGRIPEFTWSSDDDSVATVTSYGYVSLVGVGTTVIRAIGSNGVSGEYAVTVLENPPISEISLSMDSISAIVGDAGQTVFAYSYPYNHRDETITWSTSDPSVATVDQDGYVTYVGEGTADITATSEGGVSATCRVTVKRATILTVDVPARVSITGNVRETARFTPSEDGLYCFGISNNSNRNIVRMEITEINGLFLGITSTGIFKYNLTAGTTYSLSFDFSTWYGGDNNGSFDVTVSRAVPAEAVTVSDGDFKAGYVGSDYGFSAKLEPWNSIPEEIEWTTADPEIASVTEDGTVTFVSPGETVLTVSIPSGSSTDVTLRSVRRPAATAIGISRKVVGTVGDERYLDVSTVPEEAELEEIVWTSSDPAVVSVEDGRLEFLAEGTATVTATTASGLSATCTVTVLEPIILTEGETVTVDITENYRTKLLFTPEESGEYAFLADNPTGDGLRAEVYLSYNGGKSYNYGTNGVVGGNLEAGTTYVVAVNFTNYRGNGNGTADVTASKRCPAESMTVSPETFFGYIGSSFTPEAVFAPWNAADENVNWSSSDPSVAKVEYGGRISLLTVGEAVITGTSENGFTATMTVSVKEPERISLDETRTVKVAAPGESGCFIFTPEEDGVYAFTSISKVDTYGYVKDSEWNTLTYNDDSGEGNNFRVKYAMKGGTSYILQAQLYSTNDTGTFDVTVTTAKTPSELVVTNLPDRTEYVEGFVSEALDLTGLRVRVNWTDGTSDIWSYEQEDNSRVGGEQISYSTYSANAGYVTVTCEDKSVTVPLDLIEDPVDRIEVDKESERKYYENAEGRFVMFTDPVTLDRREVFRYDERDPSDAVIRVFFKDGTEKTVSVGDRLDGYRVSWSSNQTNVPWTLGDNPLTVSYLGHEATLTAAVLENPVESLELVSGTVRPLVEEVDGYVNSYWDDVTGDRIEYFRYSYSFENVVLKIKYVDGTEKEVTPYQSVDGFSVSVSDNQMLEPWTVGNENPITVSYLGKSATIYATVTENPIESLELISAPTASYYLGDPDYLYEYAWGENEFRPYDLTGFSFRANFKDGTSKVYTSEEINANAREIDGHSFTLTAGYPEEPDDAFPVIFGYMGFTLDYTVVVENSPILSIEVTKGPDNPNYTNYTYPDYNGMTLRITRTDGAVSNVTVTSANSSYGADERRGTFFSINVGGEKAYIVRTNGQFEIRMLGKRAAIEGLVNADERETADLKLVRFSEDVPGFTAVVTYVGGEQATVSHYDHVATATLGDNEQIMFFRTDNGILSSGVFKEDNGTTYFWAYGWENFIDPSGTMTFNYTYPDGTLLLTGYIARGAVATIPVKMFDDNIGAIAEGAFSARDDLTEIRFEGTRAQWNAIVGSTDIGIGGGVKVVCSDDNVPHVHSYTETVTPPTCTEQGYTTHSCACGASYVDTYVPALGHSFGEWRVTTPPTCTGKGIETRACTRCGATEERDIPAKGHTYTDTVVPPTCTEQGCTAHVCECGDSYNDSFTPALGHDFGEWTVKDAPTCTEKGVEERVCSRCGATEERDAPAKGHTYVDTVTEPTCTEQGYTTHVCSVCGDTYVDSYVRATGHVWGPWTVVTPATETEEGLERRVCLTDPAHVEERAIPVGTHVHTMNEVAGTPATCTEDGSITYYVCSGCGRYFADPEGNEEIESEHTVIPALGHDFGEWTVKTPATCTDAGTEERACSRCDAKETRPLAATGHDYAETVTAPTCTEQGYTTHACRNCGDSYVDTYTAALGHDFGEWTVKKAASCIAAGSDERVCSRCGEKETRATEPAGHSYTDTVTAPTCTAQGYTTHTCSKCGDSYADTYTAALGHDFGKDGKNPTCTRCGAKNPNFTPQTFKDVPADAFFAEPVSWAVANGITAGTGKNTFSPEEGCTRGQVVTFLWRAAGQPEPKTSNNPFKDVKSDDYYYKAVLWAVENGVTAGTSKTTFSPNDVCTRAQIVTFMWRANGQPTPKSSTNPFKDVKAGDYFATAVLWAVENKITLGTSSNTFSPEDTCTRGQVVTFLYRNVK